ncbi:hypothetical protein GOP47_0029893 [Adiantum capillus-veneris]|nr:hypothetical protein GOP47_0029893 [Adiantum capillus-veneris]
MATTRNGQYAGIHPEYNNIGEDPRGVPAVAPSRGAFTFPSSQMVNDELALEYLGSICVYFTVFGLAFLSIGIAAIVLPVLFSSILVQHMVAWMLIISGLVCFLHFCLVFGAPGTASFFLFGVLHLAVGLWLLVQPMRTGIAFIWILLGWFLAHGLIKLIMSYEIHSMKAWPTTEVASMQAWPAIVVAGGVALAMGILNISLAPSLGLPIIGILFGIDLVVTALAVLIVSMMAYQVATQLSATTDSLLAQY